MNIMNIMNNNNNMMNQEEQERIAKALQIYHLHWGREEKKIRQFRFQQQCGYLLHRTVLLEFSYFFIWRKPNKITSDLLFKGERFDHVFVMMKRWSHRLLENHRFPTSFYDRLGDGLEDIYEQERIHKQRDRQLRHLTRSSSSLFFYTLDHLEEHASFYYDTPQGRDCLHNVNSILAL